MKLVSISLLTISLSASIATADVTVMDNDKNVTVDCSKDKEVNLIGNHIVLTLSGTCTKVTVTGNHETVVGSTTGAYVLGNHNTLTLDTVDKISVAGNHNTVTYKGPVAAKKTAVSNVGTKNTITQSK